MPQIYKPLGQVLTTPNTITNVYVTGAGTSAVVNSIYINNQDVHTSNVRLFLRPNNQTLSNLHLILPEETIPAASAFVLNLGITMGPNMILAANTTYALNVSPPPITTASNVSINAFGLEIT
jgi:hypothetical protein